MTSHKRLDDGTALIEFIWLGLLLLVPVVYILLAVFDVQRAAYGVSAASRAAGRAYVLAPDQETGAQRAYEAATVAMADQGLPLDPGALTITCVPDPNRCLSPGSTVTVTVSASQDLPFVPDSLGGSGPAIHVSSAHTEPYGSFREDRS